MFLFVNKLLINVLFCGRKLRGKKIRIERLKIRNYLFYFVEEKKIYCEEVRILCYVSQLLFSHDCEFLKENYKVLVRI